MSLLNRFMTSGGVEKFSRILGSSLFGDDLDILETYLTSSREKQMLDEVINAKQYICVCLFKGRVPSYSS